MIPQRLPASVVRELGYYVYLYINPVDDKVFYVGKGKGNRVLDHLKDESESNKVQLIKELRSQGYEPRIEILIHGLHDEDTAFRIEAAVIDLLGINDLTNSVRGWRSGYYGRMDLAQLISLYERDPAKIEDPVILIRVNQLYHYGMADVELYDATRGIWRVGENRNKAKYAFAVYEGIVREVYEIKQWLPAGSTFSTRDPHGVYDSERWEFVGKLANDNIRTKYLLKSVENYFSSGSQNPITYVNC